MKPENFEQKLQRQSLRQAPVEWRAEILAAARVAETSRCGVGQRSALSLPAILSIFNRQLSSLLWPHPKAWAGLAAVWILIFMVDFSMRDTTRVVAEKAVPPSPEVMVELKKQQRMFAELVGSSETRDADRPEIFSPKPRSECVEILMT